MKIYTTNLKQATKRYTNVEWFFIRAYLQPQKSRVLLNEFNLKLVVELGGDVG